LQRALDQQAILLTKDKDFGEMTIRQRRATNGLVLIRIEALNKPENIEIVVKFLLEHIDELPQSLSVIQEDKIRIRKLS
jgi:predicted nuclease of predicted toxin-antitoxin system